MKIKSFDIAHILGLLPVIGGTVLGNVALARAYKTLPFTNWAVFIFALNATAFIIIVIILLSWTHPND